MKRRWIGIGTLSVLIMACPFTFEFLAYSESSPEAARAIHFGMIEFLALTYGVFIAFSHFPQLRIFLRKSNLPMLAAFPASIALSHLIHGNIREAVMEGSQAFLYFGIVQASVLCLLKRTAEVSDLENIARRTLVISAAVNCSVAIFQRYLGAYDPYFVRGFFGSSHLLGGFSVGVFPLVGLGWVAEEGFLRRAGRFAAAWLMGISLTYFWAIFIIAILFPIFAMFGDKKKRFPAILLSTFFLLGVFTASATSHPKSLPWEDTDSLASQFERAKKISAETLRGCELTVLGFALKIQTANPFTSIEEGGMESSLSAEYQVIEESGFIGHRLSEWLAALNLAADNPVFGVGWGQFQRKIGEGYLGIPKVNTLEPGSENTYLLILASAGILGLFAFIAYCREVVSFRIPEMHIFFSRPFSHGVGCLLAYGAFTPLTASTFAGTFILFLSLAGMSASRHD